MDTRTPEPTDISLSTLIVLRIDIYVASYLYYEMQTSFWDGVPPMSAKILPLPDVQVPIQPIALRVRSKCSTQGMGI